MFWFLVTPIKQNWTTVQNVEVIVLKTCQHSTPLAGGQKKDMNAHHDSQSKKKFRHFSSFNNSFFGFLVEYLIGSTVFPLWSFLPPFWPKAVKSSFFFWTDLKWIDHRLLQTVKSVTRQWAYSFKLWSERKKKEKMFILWPNLA